MAAGTVVGDLVTLITELEGAPGLEEFTTIRHSAAELRIRAVAAGDDESVHRCDVIIADALIREGHLGPGGHSARRTLEWAERAGESYLQARAHGVLSKFYRLLGDFSESLVHGVRAVTFLPDHAPPAVRARHLLQLACALDDNGSFDEGDARYLEVLRLAAEVGDDGLALRALNNMTYNAYERGDEPAARALAVRMKEVAGRGRGLTAKEIDTIARVEMMAGRFAALETTLAGVLAGTVVDVDGDGTVECLLTLAEARRRNGSPETVQPVLDRAAELCDTRGLARARVQVIREQAAVYAATGRYREAYEELLSYQERLAGLQDTQREARARAVQVLFETDEARRATEQFRELAHRDALTGLYNRRYADEYLAELVSRGEPLAVAIVDLDHFKQINDTLSHATGDAVLQQVAYLLQDAVAGTGVAARLGGEEFLLILPGCDVAGAARLGEDVRCLIRDFGWAAVTGSLPVTASIGVAAAAPGLTSAAPLLAAADRQLYVAKHTGRDRVAA